MLFTERNDGLNAVRGIFNALLLTFYSAVILAAGILLWVALS